MQLSHKGARRSEIESVWICMHVHVCSYVLNLAVCEVDVQKCESDLNIGIAQKETDSSDI